MTRIPEKLKRDMLADPYYRRCARENSECAGRITWEHAFIHAGKQIQELWAIIPLCAFHHAVDEYQDGGDLCKEINQFLALSRATAEDLAKYPKTNWGQMFSYLSSKYAVPHCARTAEGHIVIKGDNGTLSCNCLSFVYRSRCSHVDTFVGEGSTLRLPFVFAENSI